MELIFAVIAGLAIWAFISKTVDAPASSLQKKFVSLGNLQGKSKTQIISVVGLPNSISDMGNGETLCQWIVIGYHVSLLFSGGICKTVTHVSRT
jgi:hypothetical protein